MYRHTNDEQLDLIRSMVRNITKLYRKGCSSSIRVKRGVAAQDPSKYVLDDKELERVSALARIELEDAKLELERAHEAAKLMGKGAEAEEADDGDEVEDEVEDDWVE